MEVPPPNVDGRSSLYKNSRCGRLFIGAPEQTRHEQKRWGTIALQYGEHAIAKLRDVSQCQPSRLVPALFATSCWLLDESMGLFGCERYHSCVHRRADNNQQSTNDRQVSSYVSRQDARFCSKVTGDGTPSAVFFMSVMYKNMVRKGTAH